MTALFRYALLIAVLLAPADSLPAQVAGEALQEKDVLEAIRTSRAALVALQQPDGSWSTGGHQLGMTALTTLSLLNSGMKPDEPEIQRALNWLRTAEEPEETYETALALMVYSTVRAPQDRLRIRGLVSKLEGGMIQRGGMKGCWKYHTTAATIDTEGDHSNGQYAVLGLFEAAQAGVMADRKTWEAIREHWVRTQNPDGGWGYNISSDRDSTGSMTVAGISVLVMASYMLRDDGPLDAEGNPQCCIDGQPDESIERGVKWMTSRFSVGSNPGKGGWLFYYLYGLERAGRLSGRRFFGEHDWYREGARFLVRGRNKRTSLWDGEGFENDPVVTTSFALLFLSKGLAPVLINKLQFDTTAGKDSDWNRHTDDVRNLTDRLTGAEGWPKLMTWQVVDLKAVRERGDVSDLNQAPVLYLSGADAPQFNDQDVALLREYISLGGFVLAVNNCGQRAFRDGIAELLKRMYPSGEVALQRLSPDHPVFRAEYLLDGSTMDLQGADFGCRTALILVPDDLACFWQRWGRMEPPGRPEALKTRIERAMRIGTNIVAYASGREPLNKLERDRLAARQDQVVTARRGLLQIARLRHTGGWDTAPTAARNLLMALNQTVGLTASTEPAAVVPTDPSLLDYSMVTMHGRQRFTLTPEERDALKIYLLRGRVLFADACCGARAFDDSFRTMVQQLFPDQRMERIPVGDPLFTIEVGHDLRQVRRRVSEQIGQAAITSGTVAGEPYLEGLQIDGRWVIIYSKYDISCALERQASVACAGYVPEDAVKLAVNVVQYALQSP